MKQLYEARKAKKHRQLHWCRRPNAFSDQPIWRLAAARCNMPLYQLLAFVNRLEEHANNAANHGLIRGSLQLFDADEFGVALGMTGEECARLYAALEDPKIGWIVEDHIASFCDRNPDREEDVDDTRNRKRRQRSRERVLKQLAKLARVGKVEAADRASIEVALRGLSDDQLRRLQDELARAELSTGHKVTLRDIVTVTPEQSRSIEKEAPPVGNFGDAARGETGGLAKGETGEGGGELEQASRWIDSEGKRLLVERIVVNPNVATTYLERWRRDLQDDAVLQAIIVGAAERGKSGAQFHILIGDAVQRAVRERRDGRQLGLMPPSPRAQPAAPAAVESHNVTPSPVDSLKRSAS